MPPAPRQNEPEAEFPVTDDRLDAPDGTLVFDEDRQAWYERCLNRWRLRTDIQVLSVGKLQKTADPFRSDVWDIGPLTRLAVTRAVNRLRAGKRFLDDSSKPRPFLAWADPDPKRDRRRWHIERIAWLVVHGWEDPIEIDVGVPFLGCCPRLLAPAYWIVCDGNHRLAAAIYRGDSRILASCSGQKDIINRLLDTGK